MRCAPDPLTLILKYPTIQALPADQRQELSTLISHLEGVDLDTELEELQAKRGHYSYAMTMFTGRFRYSEDNYIKRDQDRPQSEERTARECLMRSIRRGELEELDEGDFDVIKCVVKRFIDGLDQRRELEKERRTAERWADADEYYLD